MKISTERSTMFPNRPGVVIVEMTAQEASDLAQFISDSVGPDDLARRDAEALWAAAEELS